VDSRELEALNSQGAPRPRISVVTPSLNQAQFIEATIRSVLLQGYPDLEYFIVDGGSTDQTVEIIRRYSPWLASWASGPDSGQSDAINRGLLMASGEFACWINSDDLLCRNALVRQASEIGFEPDRVYVGKCVRIDERGRYVFTDQGRIRSLEDLLRVKTVWRAGRAIVQPEVLFPRRLALAVGTLDVHNHNTMDYELWGKFFLAGARFEYTPIPFGMSRRHGGQKTHDRLRQTESLVETARNLVGLAQGLPAETRREILQELEEYLDAFRRNPPRDTGRLDGWGLPPAVVHSLRGLRRWLIEKFRKGPR
jgi:glycosyltransferase involved in cell wall biosynthesis